MAPASAPGPYVHFAKLSYRFMSFSKQKKVSSIYTEYLNGEMILCFSSIKVHMILSILYRQWNIEVIFRSEKVNIVQQRSTKLRGQRKAAKKH